MDEGKKRGGIVDTEKRMAFKMKIYTNRDDETRIAKRIGKKGEEREREMCAVVAKADIKLP